MIAVFTLMSLLALVGILFNFGICDARTLERSGGRRSSKTNDDQSAGHCKEAFEKEARQDRPEWERKTCCTDSDGNKWLQVHSRAKNSTIHKGGFDEVIKVFKNGKYQGHVTRHYDAEGKLRNTNRHGKIDVPCNLGSC